jgi:hypothetical protein
MGSTLETVRSKTHHDDKQAHKHKVFESSVCSKYELHLVKGRVNRLMYAVAAFKCGEKEGKYM